MIFDKIRKKYVRMLPEEKVRQKMILFLTREKNFPELLLKVERKILDNDNIRSLRTDIIVYEKNSTQPLILIECKSEKIKITTHTIEQVMKYNSLINARYIILTNEKKILCLEKKENKYTPARIPFYEKIN